MGVGLRRGVAFAFGAAPLVACSVLTDLSGLSGGGASGDAAPPEASPGDVATADVSMHDGPRVDGDSAVDAGGSEDGAPPAMPWCKTLSPAPTFCDDFDEGPLGVTWTDAPTAFGGSNKLDSTAWRSPPSAFLASTPMSSSNPPVAFLTRTFATPRTLITLAFDMRLDTTDPSAVIAFGGYEFSDPQGGAPSYLRLVMRVTHASLEEDLPNGDGGYGYTDYALAMIPKQGTWVRVTLSVDYTAAPAVANVTFDGVNVLTAQAISSRFKPAGTKAQVGIIYASPPTGPWNARFDDATFDER